MNKELISIVIPVYKVEQYVAKCLDSIIAQTYSNIEILIVDDGSPDNSGAICDEYATKDSRIKVFHIPNGGVAKARQLGVENSSGEYIVFVDPDDWLPDNSVEILYSNMSDDEDIVVGSYTKVKSCGKIDKQSKDTIIDDFMMAILTQMIHPTPWGKLIRRSLFTSNSFPNMRRMQDWLMFIEIGSRVRQTKIISDVTYFYLISDTSTSINYKLDIDYTKQFTSNIKSLLVQNNKYEQYKKYYYEAVLILFSWMNQVKHPLDRSNSWIKGMVAEMSKEELTKKGSSMLRSIKYRFLDYFLKFLRRINK